MSYLAGPVPVQSSWVVSIGYWADDDRTGGIRKFLGIGIKRGLIVTYKSGARCFYEGITERQYRSMLAASSKGQWVHRNIYNHPYRLV